MKDEIFANRRTQRVNSAIEDYVVSVPEFVNRKATLEGELATLEHQQKEAYFYSLYEPKKAIREYVRMHSEERPLDPLILDLSPDIPNGILSAQLQRVSVVFSYPELALKKDDFKALHISIELLKTDLPTWQSSLIMKRIKRSGFLEISNDNGICWCSIEKQPETVFQKLVSLASIAEEIDGPFTYEND